MNTRWIPKLALRTLIGAGLRTWLNVIVLSFAFIAIVGLQGIYTGMNEQVSDAMVRFEIANGQYWHPQFDPYDPTTLSDAHGTWPNASAGNEAPILMIQGTIYPQGRMKQAVLKGIDPNQKVLELPTAVLADSTNDLPVLIGNRMAELCGLKKSDQFLIRWRDARGAFDAIEATVVGIMNTSVPTIDAGQIWLPLDKLQTMCGLQNEATIVVSAAATGENVSGWIFKSQFELLNEIREIVRMKSVSASFLYAMLLFLSAIAIFDTQVLSVFRRRREIGMLMALGMTRARVIQLFTVEGAFHGILAVLLSMLFGAPLFGYLMNNGIDLPLSADQYGIAIGEKLFPQYGPFLVIGTTLLVMLVVTVVSFIPARRILNLKPTDALRGKWS